MVFQQANFAAKPPCRSVCFKRRRIRSICISSPNSPRFSFIALCAPTVQTILTSLITRTFRIIKISFVYRPRIIRNSSNVNHPRAIREPFAHPGLSRIIHTPIYYSSTTVHLLFIQPTFIEMNASSHPIHSIRNAAFSHSVDDQAWSSRARLRQF